MTIIITWWMIIAILFLIPFVYMGLREPGDWWDIQLDVIIIIILCWALALGILLGKIF